VELHFLTNSKVILVLRQTAVFRGKLILFQVLKNKNLAYESLTFLSFDFSDPFKPINI